MEFALDSSGTAQQQQWVRDAIADCSYPLDDIPVAVDVVWSDTLPPSDIGHEHPYMVTTPPGVTTEGFGTATITIASWADDPTNPDLNGLPAHEDVYGFYKECFVHELGHVVSRTTFAVTDDTAEVAAMCALLTSDTALVGWASRSGTAPDWPDPADPTRPWAALIIEAVAEIFKCAFYTERLIYGNRTAWTVSEENWSAFLKLLVFTQVSVRVTSGEVDTGWVNFGVQPYFGSMPKAPVLSVAWSLSQAIGFTTEGETWIPTERGSLSFTVRDHAPDGHVFTLIHVTNRTEVLSPADGSAPPAMTYSSSWRFPAGVAGRTFTAETDWLFEKLDPDPPPLELPDRPTVGWTAEFGDQYLSMYCGPITAQVYSDNQNVNISMCQSLIGGCFDPFNDRDITGDLPPVDSPLPEVGQRKLLTLYFTRPDGATLVLWGQGEFSLDNADFGDLAMEFTGEGQPVTAAYPFAQTPALLTAGLSAKGIVHG